MKMHHYRLFLAGFAAILIGLLNAPDVCGQGIPEPGLIQYGSVTSTLTGSLINETNQPLKWTLSGGTGANITVTSIWVVVNNQAFYIAQVPFETRAVPGMTFAATPNTFELTTANTTYTRNAKIGVIPTVFVTPAQVTFTFSAADRGRIERVDLQAASTNSFETYEQWSQRIFGRLVDRNADPLGKGMTYYQQYVAGVDPLDPNAVFGFIGIRPILQGGVVIQWSSVAGMKYCLERSTNVVSGYTLLQSTIPATPLMNSFTDPTATGAGPYFYRLRIQP